LCSGNLRNPLEDKSVSFVLPGEWSDVVLKAVTNPSQVKFYLLESPLKYNFRESSKYSLLGTYTVLSSEI
jgi:hypothetical protein